MPLLNKQKFVKEPIPPNLDPEQEIFYSKLTQEIFIDYDEYFERTILCNSLVWTCALTGKSGLTFGEALESETRARKVLSTFPQHIERAIVFLVSLSKRGNIKDLVDDIFSYIKDRFFLDETVQLINQINSKTEANKTHKIVDIIIPGSSNQLSKSLSKQKVDDDLMDVTIESESPSVNKSVDIDPSKIKYVIETSSTLTPNTTRQTVKANQIIRAKNLVTKDKTYMIIKKNCEVLNQSVWTLTESAMKRFNVSQMKFSDIFRGEPPLFEHTFGRGQFSRANLSKNGSPKQQQLSFDKSSGKLVSVNNGDLNTSQSSKKKSQLNDSKNAKSTSGNKKPTSSPSKSNNISKTTSSKTSPKSSSKATAKASSQSKSVVNKKTSEINQLAEKKTKIMKKKIIDMDDEEFLLWKQYATYEDLKESNLIELEFEKLEKREEKEKEKERLKNEKCKQKEYLKELKNPKEDLELENLVELPKPQPIKSKITQDMFGDAVMILEFLNYFGDLFEIKDDFPNGFNYDLLENALFSKSCDSALCNLLLFYLDSIFKCYDEETFEDGNVDSDNESNDVDFNESDEEDVSLDQLYKEPIKSVNDRESIASLAENYAKLIKSIQGRSLKNIGLDVYTISEMLRLYFITSGSSHYSKTKFWYQQRGGYTRMDEAGIDFALNEKPIIKKLEHMNVYELEPNEKLKILACLCHQLMSQVRFRDLLEDNWQKLTTSKAHLRDLQTEENRRIREETSERWKKKMEDKAKEKARLEELKSHPEQTNTNERISMGNDASALTATDKQSIESDKKRQEFLKKEKAILEEIHQLQLKCSMIPIGRDRFYRRYWMFKSLPGLFVEDEEYYICENEAQSPAKTDDKTESEPIDSKTSIKAESESTKSENDFKENKPIISDNQMDLSSCNDIKNETDENSRIKWCFYYLTDSIDQLISSLSERGLRESELKQNIVDYREKLIDSLNKFYNQSIIKNLTMSQEEIEKGILNCLKENVSNVLANSSLQNMNGTSNCKTKRQTAKLIASTISILNPNPEISSHEFMEMDLRDKLMDIEEQIYIGALGSIRVNDRNKWKEALDKNCYDPQCTNLTWAGGEFVRPALEANKQTEFESSNVLNLAKALLQIEQSVEKRFLRLPLGDSQKTPEKKKSKSKQANSDDSSENGDKNANDNKYAVLYSWEKSLMNCTSLSQVFIHLQTLDESIAWSKSALNARCRLCKRKGDAEKMLLCDKCDRGHHIYCLRPPLKTIPDGEWFCPECKPKDNEKTQRKMRKSFGNENGNEEICLDDNDNDETANSEATNDEEEDEDEENEIENDEDEEEADEESAMECEDEENEEENGEENEEENGHEDAESFNEVNSNHSHNTDRSNQSQEKNPKRGIKIIPKNKLKLNGKHLNNENAQNSTNESNHSDEEMVNISSDDTENTKRITRKRKLDSIQDKKPLNNSKSQKTNGQNNTLKGKSVNSKSTSSLKDTSTSSKENNKSTTNRSFRNKSKLDYNELSDDISGTGTDEDTFYKNSKRNKTSKASSNVLNDFQMNNTNSRNTEMANRLKVIEKLLNDMMKHKDSWPFLKPVSKREAPDYFEVIKKPMDFATIKNNINNFKYADYTHIIEDIRLVFDNCREYNEPKSDIYETGERLSSYFERHAKQAGLLDTKQLALNYH